MVRWRYRIQDGYTLAELLVVCGIIGLIMLLAIPNFGSTRDTLQLRGAADNLAADIRLAQIMAQREARMTRLQFDTVTGTYELQLATSVAATSGCEDSNYETVKRVELGSEYSVNLAKPPFPSPVNPTIGCLAFESTGRTAWPGALVFRTTPSDSGAVAVTRFLNRVEAPEGDGYTWGGNQTVLWTEAYSGRQEVVLALDLGSSQYLQNICPQFIEDQHNFGSEVNFPASFTVSWSNAATQPDAFDDSQWAQLGQPITAPFSEVEESQAYPGWRRSCPEVTFPGNQQVRYVRFVVNMAPNLWGDKVLAMDEIKLSEPGITLEHKTGRASRRISVTSITGMVSSSR